MTSRGGLTQNSVPAHANVSLSSPLFTTVKRAWRPIESGRKRKMPFAPGSVSTVLGVSWLTPLDGPSRKTTLAAHELMRLVTGGVIWRISVHSKARMSEGTSKVPTPAGHWSSSRHHGQDAGSGLQIVG